MTSRALPVLSPGPQDQSRQLTALVLRYRTAVSISVQRVNLLTTRNTFYGTCNLPNALHFVCLNRLSCTEVGIYNRVNSSRDMEGSQNSKSRSHDPFTTPFDLILHFFA